jgi:hypothetical protein
VEKDWVPNPNLGKGGSGWGWRDKNGDVWCPTGPKNESGRGIAHGDPHWDVQNPSSGKSTNVYPGGHRR